MPSSQDVAKWVETHLEGDTWQSLEDVILSSVSKVMHGASIGTITDTVEEHQNHVEQILRNNLAFIISDGGVPKYELDPNESYIKRINTAHRKVLERLRATDPFHFEVICKLILEKLGGTADITQKSYDGGVDFYAFDLKTYCSNLALPISASLSVIGQAKKYKEANEVRENEVRNFVGGAMLKLDEFKKINKINVLSPVVYAFWTTSDLNINAKKYARDMGIWYLDGFAIADYVIKLKLEDQIDPPAL